MEKIFISVSARAQQARAPYPKAFQKCNAMISRHAEQETGLGQPLALSRLCSVNFLLTGQCKHYSYQSEFCHPPAQGQLLCPWLGCVGDAPPPQTSGHIAPSPHSLRAPSHEREGAQEGADQREECKAGCRAVPECAYLQESARECGWVYG